MKRLADTVGSYEFILCDVQFIRNRCFPFSVGMRCDTHTEESSSLLYLHGLGFLKACSGFKITYKSFLKLKPMNILKLFSPSSTWTSLVSSASGFVVQ
jgi:hypothetical protein